MRGGTVVDVVPPVPPEPPSGTLVVEVPGGVVVELGAVVDVVGEVVVVVVVVGSSTVTEPWVFCPKPFAP